MNPIEVRLERAGTVESVHEVHGAIVGPDGRRLEAFGDPGLVSFWRSAMKPFQALPIVESGVFETLGLGDPEIAIACASHHGTPANVAVVTRILDALGLDESALACGPHRPNGPEAAKALDAAGRLPGRIHNNCSGKHAGMLALAWARGWEGEGYHLFAHPVQSLIRAQLRVWLEVDPEPLPWGVDGCGVPTPALSLEEMAWAYARLARARSGSARRVVTAMTTSPILVSGEHGLSTRLMAAGKGRIVAKEGAEGVFCLAESTGAWAAAFKVRDGAVRALGPSVVGALSGLGLLEEAEREQLGEFEIVSVENTRAEAVGEVRASRIDAARPVDCGV